jgi:hypothetical protein
MEAMPLANVTVPSPLSTTVTLAPVPLVPPGLLPRAKIVEAPYITSNKQSVKILLKKKKK